ncbi:PepSY-associated TM helix, putative [Beutenbergia cavernae DSM 12333]|uniref:PepSY-associated TM helix, putative n=1 Tax=Beutenbergia cavernae (strain ATCC BAA-8 / DSM 12333 / CCUG 43141 / JCM 11478 / NBRC 16432 / NCIMB 13614 / HKI 0122) TaxID=471853 RepID=C5C4F1_BEUC1|nr:PepSY-associated TM helix, putative [Beutenbergia cavernae DSM 12333]
MPGDAGRADRRRRTATARGVGAVAIGVGLVALALALLPGRTWDEGGSEAWAMTVYLVVAGASLLLALVVAAQAFAIARRRDRQGSGGGADLVTVLAVVLLLVGAGVAFVRGVPDGAGPYVLGVQVLGGIALVILSAGNGKAARERD